MNNQQCPDNTKAILQAFSRALAREAHVLTQHPELLWQQMYNREFISSALIDRQLIR